MHLGTLTSFVVFKSTYQVLMLVYAIAVYPFLLVFITIIFVKLHDNFSFAVVLWRSFHKCLIQFRKQLNIHSSLVNALATFIVLPYIKIFNVSFDLLTPSTMYNMDGQRMNVYLCYDGTVEIMSMEYSPYLTLAIVIQHPTAAMTSMLVSLWGKKIS